MEKSIILYNYENKSIIPYQEIKLYELWLPVIGYEDIYEISSMGRLRNIKKKNAKHKEYIVKPWLAKNPGRVRNNRYPCYSLCKNGKQLSIKIHRLVITTFLGERISKDLQINHINGIKTDNRLINLEYITAKENIRHALDILHIKRAVGEKTGSAKLRENDVISIREMYSEGYSIRTIALNFNISRRTISDIIHYKTWKHI